MVEPKYQIHEETCPNCNGPMRVWVHPRSVVWVCADCGCEIGATRPAGDAADEITTEDEPSADPECQ